MAINLKGNATSTYSDSATFGGDITFTPPTGVGGIGSRILWTTESPFLDEVASIDSSRSSDSNAATDLVFNTGGGTTGAISETLRLAADGSATFKGDVLIGDSASSTTESGCYLGDYGGVVVNAVTDTTSDRLFLGKNKNNTVAEINADGSAQFMGQLQISTATIGALTEKVLLHENGWVRAYNSTVDASANVYLAYSNVNGNGTVVFYVTADGQIHSRNNSITQIGSERRIKKDIELIDPVKSWETIRDLPYYSYKLNGNDESTYYGPIVDECPEEMVVEGATSDEQGNIRTYDNSLLQGRLFVALQEALTRIEALESEVQVLKDGSNPPT